MTLGKKGKRVICVVHIDPSLSCDILVSKDNSLAAFAKKVVCDDKGYESDSSNEEYWFSKWSRPLRTVKRFQAEHLEKQNIIGLIKNRLPATDKTTKTENSDTTTDLKVISTFAVEQSSQIIQEASQEASNQISTQTSESAQTEENKNKSQVNGTNNQVDDTPILADETVKIKWSTIGKQILRVQDDNELPLKKFQKKIVKDYLKQIGGSGDNESVDALWLKCHQKLSKNSKFQIDGDKIKLVL